MLDLILLTLIDYPIHTDAISIDLSSLYFMRSQVEISNFNIFLSLKIVFILAKKANPDKILTLAAFHMSLHCLPKYQCLPVSSMTRVKGNTLSSDRV